MKIIIDIHEKNSLVISELVSQQMEIEVKKIPVADYIIGNIAIERKTVSDFISSMINKRLARQLEEMKQYPKQLLVIEGIEEQELYSDNQEKGIHPNAIRGMLLSILLEFNIPIILTKDYQDTAKFLILIKKRQEREPKQISLKVKKKTLDLAEQQQFIIEGFPGIGPATAKALLKKFKTIRNIINAKPQQLEKIIRKKTSLMKRITESKYPG